MIAITGPCMNPSAKPLGIVAADGEWCEKYIDRLTTLIEKLRNQAPEGSTHLYNLRWERREYRGYHYLCGWADSYKEINEPEGE